MSKLLHRYKCQVYSPPCVKKVLLQVISFWKYVPHSMVMVHMKQTHPRFRMLRVLLIPYCPDWPPPVICNMLEHPCRVQTILAAILKTRKTLHTDTLSKVWKASSNGVLYQEKYLKSSVRVKTEFISEDCGDLPTKSMRTTCTLLGPHEWGIHFPIFHKSIVKSIFNKPQLFYVGSQGYIYLCQKKWGSGFMILEIYWYDKENMLV